MEVDKLTLKIETTVSRVVPQLKSVQHELSQVSKALNAIDNNKVWKATVTQSKATASQVKKSMQDIEKAVDNSFGALGKKYANFGKGLKTPEMIPDIKAELVKAERSLATAQKRLSKYTLMGDRTSKGRESAIADIYFNRNRVADLKQALDNRRNTSQISENESLANSIEKIADAEERLSKVRARFNYSGRYGTNLKPSNIEPQNVRFNTNPITGERFERATQPTQNAPQQVSEQESLTKKLAETETKLEEVRGKLADIKGESVSVRDKMAGIFDRVRESAQGFKNAIKERGLDSGVLRYTEEYVSLMRTLDRTREAKIKLDRQMDRHLATGGKETDKTYQQYKYDIEEATNSIRELERERQDMYDSGEGIELDTSVAQKKLEMFKKTLRDVFSWIKRTARAIGSFALKLSGLGSSARKARSAMDSMKKISKNLTKELTRVSKMLKLMITRMALRKVIEEVGNGFKSLALHSKEFNDTISSLMNGSKKLGYSISAMVAPLIQALAPALLTIINLATRAVNVLNQLFSSLGGATTWNKAKDFSDSFADSVSGANAKAKELKKTVLGFDELNQLQDNSDSSSGGSDITDMFETLPIESKVKDLADKIKDAWKTGDFYELGKEFGDWLANLLADIPWDKIKANARKLGRSLATLLNGIMDGVADDGRKLSTLIGQTVAECINTLFEFLHEFVLSFNWKRLGEFLAETLNGLFDTIDWDLIKDTFIWGAKGLADGINSFIEEFNWDNISDTIANAVFALSGAIYTFFNTTDFDKLGHKLGEQLRLTIEKIDWETVGKALGSIVQSAIDFVGGFLEEQDWDTIKEAIKELLKGFFEVVDKEELAKVIFSVLGVAILAGVTKLVAWGICTKIAGKIFGSGFASAIGVEGSKSGIASAIGNIFKTANVEASLSGAGTFMSQVLLGDVGANLSAGGAVAGATGGLAIAGGVVSAFVGYGIGNKLGQCLDEDLYKPYEGFDGFFKLCQDTVTTFTERTGEHFGELKVFASDLGTSMKESFNQTVTDVGEDITKLRDNFIKVFNKIGETFGKFKSDLKSGFEGIGRDLKGVWNSIANSLNGTHDFGIKKFTVNLPVFRYAQGGVLEDGLFTMNHGEMAGKFDNGKSVVANNEMITTGIERAVLRGMSSAMSNNGGSQYINNDIYIDGDKIASAVTKAQSRQNRRYSPVY